MTTTNFQVLEMWMAFPAHSSSPALFLPIIREVSNWPINTFVSFENQHWVKEAELLGTFENL